MKKSVKKELVEYLRDFVTEDRWQRISEVLDQRTRHITVVLEDIYQPHNASAVLRSCDGFGIQDVHIIENKNEFDPNEGVTIGADQWITLHTYSEPDINNTEQCFQELRNQGYQIIATTPHTNDVTIEEVPIEQKTALVFGAELTGLSDYALEQADGFARIPMQGFSESFNISVGAALCLYEVAGRMRRSELSWRLNANEKLNLQCNWLQQSLRAGKKLTKRFLEQQESLSE
ncbi:MAG: RNA methyltransferase [Fodinibius sp.]|nr:RNA methyltransferase [Fodinibius sp.]